MYNYGNILHKLQINRMHQTTNLGFNLAYMSTTTLTNGIIISFTKRQTFCEPLIGMNPNTYQRRGKLINVCWRN